MPAQHDGNDVSWINIGLQSDRSKHLNIKKKKRYGSIAIFLTNCNQTNSNPH